MIYKRGFYLLCFNRKILEVIMVQVLNEDILDFLFLDLLWMRYKVWGRLYICVYDWIEWLWGFVGVQKIVSYRIVLFCFILNIENFLIFGIDVLKLVFCLYLYVVFSLVGFV